MKENSRGSKSLGALVGVCAVVAMSLLTLGEPAQAAEPITRPVTQPVTQPVTERCWGESCAEVTDSSAGGRYCRPGTDDCGHGNVQWNNNGGSGSGRYCQRDGSGSAAGSVG